MTRTRLLGAAALALLLPLAGCCHHKSCRPAANCCLAPGGGPLLAAPSPPLPASASFAGPACCTARVP
jgi:hypothetical protein